MKFTSEACIVLQVWFTHAVPLQAILSSTDLSAAEWLRVVAAGLFVFCMSELEKAGLQFARRWRSSMSVRRREPGAAISKHVRAR
ncbi:MAG: hypothetical protein IRZ28_08895 [Steroidobacteraceae bacterium]|nr:hypothetical protein [Steroidobacteraceae bacterium]